jgi:hypothetical protein
MCLYASVSFRHITLEVYAHLFERADHAHAAREALEASYERRSAPCG